MTIDGAVSLFEAERPRLKSLAYRMLGEHAGAEDIVQDVWLKWQGSQGSGVANPQAWLTTVTTRAAIDALKSARARREVYVGPWLPEALVEGEGGGDRPDAGFEQRQDVSLALLWAMERLAPEERAAFLLRDVFDLEYREIADALDKAETACRQLVSRARKRVKDGAPRFDASAAEVSQLLDRFMTATASLDRAEIMALLSPDVLAISDGGGKASAALRPLEGASEVAQVWLAVAARKKDAVAPQKIMVNGLPALAVLSGGEDDMIVTVMPDRAGRISWIYILRNPEKIAASKG